MPAGLGANFVILIVFIVGIYFLLIRPQKKKEKAIASMRDSIQAGYRIVTIGGICGKVVKTNPETLIIQVGADKTKFEVMRWSVSSVTSKSKSSSDRTDEKKEVKKFTPKKLKKDKEEKNNEDKVKHGADTAAETGAVAAEEIKESNAESTDSEKIRNNSEVAVGSDAVDSEENKDSLGDLQV